MWPCSTALPGLLSLENDLDALSEASRIHPVLRYMFLAQLWRSYFIMVDEWVFVSTVGWESIGRHLRNRCVAVANYQAGFQFEIGSYFCIPKGDAYLLKESVFSKERKKASGKEL